MKTSEPIIENPKSRIQNPDDLHIYRPDLPRRGPAIVAMFVSGFLFAVMGLMTKLLHEAAYVGRPLPAAEVTLCRFAFGGLVMLPLHGRRGIDLLGNNRRGLFLRGIWGAFAVTFYFLSLQTTSLIHAQLLNYTAIIFTPLFAYFLVKERITGRTAGAILIAVAGILLITFRSGTSSSQPLGYGDAYGLISGIMAGAAVGEVRRLRQTESAWSIFFYLSLVGVPVASITCLLPEQHPVMPTPTGLLVLSIMAVSSVGGQMLMTYGYKYVQAAEGSLITMTQIVYNAVAGAFLFGEHLTLPTLAGAALIVGATMVTSAGSPRTDQSPRRLLLPFGHRSVRKSSDSPQAEPQQDTRREDHATLD